MPSKTDSAAQRGKRAVKYSLAAAMAGRAGKAEREQKPATAKGGFTLAGAMRRRAKIGAGD